MELKDRTVLVLGGAGLVDFPVARRMIEHAPSRLIITSLHRKDAEEDVNELQAQPIAQATSIEPAWLSRSATVPV
jgi:NAD(P)-dependent dehydrogenase (short-subunit alcohol dehydrogenase family)